MISANFSALQQQKPQRQQSTFELVPASRTACHRSISDSVLSVSFFSLLLSLALPFFLIPRKIFPRDSDSHGRQIVVTPLARPSLLACPCAHKDAHKVMILGRTRLRVRCTTDTDTRRGLRFVARSNYAFGREIKGTLE